MFNGKAIYNPSGKAGEYAAWACNFYVGCSNGCQYCYCKKGILAPVMGQDKPQLKKCFKDKVHALEIFGNELCQNLDELRTHGLFFSFTTDPLLNETKRLTYEAIEIAHAHNVPVKLLTKRSDFNSIFTSFKNLNKELIAFGFTLTGHDELEPNASTNAERIEAMKKLHDAGFKIFASIEPIIDFVRSADMIERTWDFCNLYKIGLMSGKQYEKLECKNFIEHFNWFLERKNAKIYWKDSLLKVSGIERSDLPANCVDRDYNIWRNESLQ